MFDTATLLAERDALAARVRELEVQQLKQHWGAFCDADPTPPEFAEQMEAAGLIELVPVTEEALEDAFAAERGIERGGMMWRLTAAGRAALAPKEKNDG